LNTNEQCNMETYQNSEKPWLHTRLQRYGHTCLTMCFIHISHMMVTHAAQSCKGIPQQNTCLCFFLPRQLCKTNIFPCQSFFRMAKRQRPHSNRSTPSSSINTSISLDLPDGGTILTRTIELGTTKRMQSW
jgi:hypothetical protein